MAGMLQIITYVLCFYLVIKGIEILQIGLTSARNDRVGVITVGALTLAACIIASVSFVGMQDDQANAVSKGFSTIAPQP